MNTSKLKNLLTNERNLYPALAYIIIFLSMMSQAPITAYGFVQVILLMFIAYKIYQTINLYGFNILDLGKIAFFSGTALIGISQLFQHVFHFSFVDWLVTFTKFNQQAPISILGIFAFVALPLAFGAALNYRINKKKAYHE
ncbi:hypothetical protein [Pseudomonas coronafaciens]|uniref:hypothetical protein n=1 Tax=Pseudomonas coronafaciens TaxID=53409 RepID=UPI00379CA597